MGSIAYFDWLNTYLYLLIVYQNQRKFNRKTTIVYRNRRHKKIGLHIIQPLLFEIPLFGRNSAVGRCSDVIYKRSNGTDISNC